MGKQMVRCPRDERVARPSAMIHLLPCTPWIMAVLSRHVSMVLPAPPKSVTASIFFRVTIVEPTESAPRVERTCYPKGNIKGDKPDGPVGLTTTRPARIDVDRPC